MFKIPWLPGVLCALMLVSALPAGAKTIPMRPVSRGAVDSACGRAGGSAYGIHDDAPNYGCVATHGKVDCGPDGTCFGSVSDLVPMTANSLDAVLNGGVRAQPIKIGPADRRITPLAQP